MKKARLLSAIFVGLAARFRGFFPGIFLPLSLLRFESNFDLLSFLS